MTRAGMGVAEDAGWVQKKGCELINPDRLDLILDFTYYFSGYHRLKN